MNKPNGSCECERIKAENERMRKALREIADEFVGELWDTDYPDRKPIKCECCVDRNRIAKAALKGGKE